MKKRIVSLLVLLMVVGLAGAMPVMADDITAPDGKVFTTDANGYIQIGDDKTLTEFAKYVNNAGGNPNANAVLTKDIVLETSTVSWIPIGMDESHQYYGTFNGAGHTVSGIYINAASDPQGLFGTVGSSAKIENLGVINSWISGSGSNSDSGGVVGRNYGSISNCYNSGTISGVSVAGGVVGSNNHGTISNCYNTGAVTGNGFVGGVAGENGEGTISNCYNTGMVSGNGVVGMNMGPINNCYYLGTTATPDGSGATVKTTGDFGSGEVAWLLQNGQTLPEGQTAPSQVWGQKLTDSVDALPVLKSTDPVYKITMNYNDTTLDQVLYRSASGVIPLPTPVDGTIYTYTQADGTIRSQTDMTAYNIASDETFTVKKYQLTADSKGVIQIDSAAALTDFSRYVNDGNTTTDAVLMKNIVLRPTTDWANWGTTPPANSTQWIPIGTAANPYSGTFNGAGLTVSGIYINATTNVPQGLFGTVGSSAKIENLGVINSWISGTNDSVGIGGIVGISHGSVSNCYNTGNVSKGAAVGGVVGTDHGTTSNCYNTGTVSGSSRVGGVAGETMKGMITNCYNTGRVSGSSSVGGVAGRSRGVGSITINNCYNTGTVTSDDNPNNNVGGVVGEVLSVPTNCYYLENSAAFGIGNSETDDPLHTAAKSTNAFASGEVAWLLQNGQAAPAAQVWGQKLTDSVDALPVLKITDPVCKITYLKGDGATTYKVGYANQNQTIIPVELTDGYSWKDANAIFTGVIPDKTKELSVHCSIATLPTATAKFGTKLSDIPFTGGSVDAQKWVWSESDNDLVPAQGNTTAYKATYASNYDIFGTATLAITPTITSAVIPKSLTAESVSIYLSASSYTATGTAITPDVTVTDTVTILTTADYSVAYTNNISPGTATVTITGQGNYAGIVTKNFTITSSGGGGGGYTPPAPPVMPGVVVNPGTITFDPAGNLAVDITGTPAGSAVYYSLDGVTFTTAPPAMENAGEHKVYVKVTSPGYQDYISQTIVTVDKHEAPVVPEVSIPVPAGQQTGSTDLGTLLPANRGQIRYQLISVNDPRAILNGTPTIDQNGRISYGFASPLSVSGENLTASAATDSATSSATITVLVTMQNYADTTIILVVSEAEAFGVQYQTHIQDIGWETDWTTDGALSGTEGQSKRLEALKVELTGEVPAGATIDTEVHVQNYGNLGPFAMGTAAGTSGKGLRLENICLTLKNLPGYTILYDVHVQNQGWLRDENDSSTWFKSGETAGTSALSLRLEGIRIKLVKND